MINDAQEAHSVFAGFHEALEGTALDNAGSKNLDAIEDASSKPACSSGSPFFRAYAAKRSLQISGAAKDSGTAIRAWRIRF